MGNRSLTKGTLGGQSVNIEPRVGKSENGPNYRWVYCNYLLS